MTGQGAEVHLVIPTSWPGPGDVAASRAALHEMAVVRPGDVNRHRYREPDKMVALVRRLGPDVIDLHEEPFSAVVHQLLPRLVGVAPVVSYTAQNVDKRYPPPFAQWERRAYSTLSGLYPCTRQAASVARGKGFSGHIEVLPLGFDDAVMTAGSQRHDDDVWRLVIAGRMVREKGLADAVRVLAAVRAVRPARLVVVGDGPAIADAATLAAELGVGDALERRPWVGGAELAKIYCGAHVVLVPSRRTTTWVEQFGRVIVEAHAAGAVVAGYLSGSIPEVARDAAVLAEEGDAQGLSRAVTDLACSTTRWQTLRAAGLAAAGGFTWTAVAQRQLDFYRRVAAAGPQRFPVVVDREQARAQWGQPAALSAGERPFALPLLRNSRGLTQVLGGALDLAGAATRRAARRVRTRS